MKVVFLGCTDNYGYGFSANVTKIGYMAKGLTEAGAECHIHNGIIGSSAIKKKQIIYHDGLPVTTLSKRGNQLFSWFMNIKQLDSFLRDNYDKNKQNIVILDISDYHVFLTYIIIAKKYKYKIISIAHEWGPTVVDVHWLRRPSLWLYTKTFGYLCDGILPISEFIIEHINHFKKPYLKVPVIADFAEMQNLKPEKHKGGFVYCGGVGYFRVIKLLIDAFSLYKKNGGSLDLTLILSGSEDRINDVIDYLNDLCIKQNVYVKTKLPYKVLMNEYINATALIIPLDPQIEQDKARFSQKIAEYLSSKTAIITNDVGEVKYYFDDTQVIKSDYSINGFAKSFTWVEGNKEKVIDIGNAGYNKGAREFDYRGIGTNLYNFLISNV